MTQPNTTKILINVLEQHLHPYANTAQTILAHHTHPSGITTNTFWWDLSRKLPPDLLKDFDLTWADQLQAVNQFLLSLSAQGIIRRMSAHPDRWGNTTNPHPTR